MNLDSYVRLNPYSDGEKTTLIANAPQTKGNNRMVVASVTLAARAVMMEAVVKRACIVEDEDEDGRSDTKKVSI
ncbi:hypothetical protein B0H66DRAFT_603424 [Apodospora peruviana]|uniref:Uncharacterized protein n=1 Tax=Apodospora peruviana TaxID=516989 RepID=A0AAE0M4F5_9PEZI|nr:hypothetical protein B0H66DRAFT_603424 [Apodospora peruviana]